MLSESVAQKPTIAVSPGTNASQNCPSRRPPGTNADGAPSIPPNPPALTYAQTSSASPRTISSGALTLSSQRIESMPANTTAMLTSQNAMNATNCGAVTPRYFGQ